MINLFQLLDCSTCPTDLRPIFQFIKHGVYPIIQIGIPILLIIMGSIDLGRAVLSSDDKEIKSATSRLVKRAIAAIAVFFVATLVSLIMGMFDSTEDNDNLDMECTKTWKACWNELD